jgi:hypothetical protein
MLAYLDGHSERPRFVLYFFRGAPPATATTSCGVQIDGFFVDQDLTGDHTFLGEPVPSFLWVTVAFPFNIKSNACAFPPLVTYGISWVIESDTECFKPYGPMPQRRFTYVLCPYPLGPEFEIRAEIGDTEFGVNDEHHWPVSSDKCCHVPASPQRRIVDEMYPTAEIVIG